jgi:8-oxo-dGTP pyrophosphatase MutT (NUDIX family)
VTDPRRAALARLLDGYEPRGEAETADVARLRAALAGDVWSRASALHVTGSALVVHPSARAVLLRWHPRMQAWLQVGGHFDPGEGDAFDVAVREAREETGLRDLHAVPEQGRRPLQVVIVPVPAHGDEPFHEHADVRYLLATERPGDIAAESAEAALRWQLLDDAIREASEDNLQVGLERARDALT